MLPSQENNGEGGWGPSTPSLFSSRFPVAKGDFRPEQTHNVQRGSLKILTFGDQNVWPLDKPTLSTTLASVPTAEPSACDDVIRRAHVSRSRGLPHREGTDGLRRRPLRRGGRRNPSVTSSRFLIVKGDFRPANLEKERAVQRGRRRHC